MRPQLLIATNNPGKLREYRTLLRGVPFEMVSPQVLGIGVTVEETGHTFEENARLKAVALAQASHLLTLADDSGLEVDALGGEPGVKSARYAGEDASDGDRVKYLLARMQSVPEGKRTARFRCVIALAEPSGEVSLYSGECAGVIALEPRGKYGFGYDPVFWLPGLGKTMAELPLAVKNRISHRGQAATKVRTALRRMGRH